MRVPPGVEPKKFALALSAFEVAVGKQWVFTEDADLDLYRDAYSPIWGENDERIASAAVAPATSEEVQNVVRAANLHGIPIYPISTGKNLGYGGSAPAYSGSVILDLKRLNRIIEVDEASAYVVVEPGVSYFDLYRYIRDKGLKLWLDVPDPGWGSLVGNALDRGGGYTAAQFRNHFDAHCGMEVVLSDGEVLRTGMGALPQSKTWQQYKSGFGPWIDGIFSQSNFGIVTKMGFWLMPQPETFFKASVHASRFEDLGPMVKALNLVENSGLSNGMPDLGSPLLGAYRLSDYATLLEEGPAVRDPEHLQLIAGSSGGYSPELQRYGLEKRLPYWTFTLAFYGPENVVRAQWEAAKAIFGDIPDVRFEDGQLVHTPLTDEQLKEVEPREFGIPSLRMFSIGARSPFNDAPTSGHVWFSPIIPRTGEAIIEANRVFFQTAKELGMVGFPTFSMPTCFWERAFVFTIGLPVTRDAEINAQNCKVFRKLIQVAAERGWGEYRTAPLFQDQVMESYGFNGNILRTVHERIKDALDPKGIIAAGRYGIWPRHLRSDR